MSEVIRLAAVNVHYSPDSNATTLSLSLGLPVETHIINMPLIYQYKLVDKLEYPASERGRAPLCDRYTKLRSIKLRGDAGKVLSSLAYPLVLLADRTLRVETIPAHPVSLPRFDERE